MNRPDFEPGEPPAAGQPPDSERLRQSELARAENLRQLRTVRNRLYDDLLGTLGWVRELVTRIHLAKYSGAPASQAEDLVIQIAATIESLSEVSHWQSDMAENNGHRIRGP